MDKWNNPICLIPPCLLLVIILVSQCSCIGFEPVNLPDPNPKSNKIVLDKYINKDLRKLPSKEKAEFSRFLASNFPKEYLDDKPHFFQPWYIWKIGSAKNKNRLIFIQGLPLFSIPGASTVAVHFLEDSGRLVRTEEFLAGWRIGIEDASLHFDKELQGTILKVKSFPCAGRNIRLQVYGIVNDRIHLLWLEDQDGKFVSNNYKAPNRTIGPMTLPRQEMDWENALASTQPMVVLEALCWLGGIHWQNDSILWDEKESLERKATIKLVKALFQNPRIRNVTVQSMA